MLRGLRSAIGTARVAPGLVAAGLLAAEAALGNVLPAAASPGAVIDSAFCSGVTMPRSDDGSSGAVPLGFTINYFGSTFQSVYVNNNGNISFDMAMSSFSVGSFASLDHFFVAPFFADVDTRAAGSQQVQYGVGMLGGHAALCVNWVRVGYFNQHDDKLNSFQLLLIDRSDTGQGNFDVVFNYDTIVWETGDGPSGGVNGFGGHSGSVGYATPHNARLQLQGSDVPGTFLDSGTRPLIQGSRNSSVLGRYIFPFRSASGASTGGLITGRVANPNNAGLIGAFVQACPLPITLGTQCQFGNTGANGQYVITGLADGSYQVTANPPSGSPLNSNSILPPPISGGNTLTGQDIMLTGPTPPPPGTTIAPARVTTPQGIPVLYWRDTLDLATHCPAGATSASFVIRRDGVPISSGSMTSRGAGAFDTRVGPLMPNVGFALVLINCSPTGNITFDIYIDPSGVVQTTSGSPVVGATVTLFRQNDYAEWVAVPAGSNVMDPGNRDNPQLTDSQGRFGWNVLAGFYKVRAEKAGCTSADGLQPFTESDTLTVPPPATNLVLTLLCPPVPTIGQASVSIVATGCTTVSTFCFSPAAVTVVAGHSVQWSNTTAASHTVTSDAGGTWTGTMAPGQTATFTFTVPGRFPYHCAIHPDMKGTLVVTPPTFYFAEGYTGAGFREQLALFMPDALGTAKIDYYTRTGHLPTVSVPLTAGKVTLEDVNADVGPGQEVSALVTLPGPGVAERLLNFDTGTWHGSTDIVGTAAPASEWDFGEGSTLDAFSEFLTLQNPNASTVLATVRYFTDSGLTPMKTLSLPPSSRTTIEVFNGGTTSLMNCVANGPAASCGVGRGIGGVSAAVTATMPIIAERPFYVNGYSFGDGVIRDGHVAFGANAPANLWDFAEGTTLPGFREYLTLQNPGQTDAMTTLRYFTNAGQTPVKTVLVRAHSRVTVEVFNGNLSDVTSCVANGPGASCGVGGGIQGVSVRVSSTLVPIVAERPMYMVHDFGGGAVAGAHVVVGANDLARLVLFAEASTVSRENDFLTIENPGSAAAHVFITYYTGTASIAKTISVPAGSRHTVEVFNSTEGAGPGVASLGIVVQSDQPMLVEKPTYSANAATYGATDTLGIAVDGF